jgi:hypothetical protein
MIPDKRPANGRSHTTPALLSSELDQIDTRHAKAGTLPGFLTPLLLIARATVRI